MLSVVLKIYSKQYSQNNSYTVSYLLLFKQSKYSEEDMQVIDEELISDVVRWTHLT